ncbi:MAG: AtpZ/AtpI family protein [Pseudomonadota bacterium]
MGDDLKKRIEAARSAYAKPNEDALSTAPSKGMGLGFRMATEFVSAVVVGGAVGWGLDQWLGTTPWLLLLCFCFGFAAGVSNVVRVAQAAQNLPGDTSDTDEGE